MKPSEEVLKYVALIDDKYLEAKKQGLGRFSEFWGKWSREMNLETRQLVEDKHPETALLNYVFVYWVNRSQLLDLHARHRMFKGSIKKRLAREGKKIKALILSGEVPQLSEEEMKNIILKSTLDE